MLVLLVEDSLDDVALFRAQTGITPEHVSTVAAARVWLGSNPTPDMVWVDVHLPDMDDGLEFALELQRDLPNTKVKAWTGRMNPREGVVSKDDAQAIRRETESARRYADHQDLVHLTAEVRRLEADVTVVKAGQVRIENELKELGDELGVVNTNVALLTQSDQDTKEQARRAADTSARVEAQLAEPGAGSYFVRKMADAINSVVMMAFAVGATIVGLAAIAALLFLGGFIEEFNAGASSTGTNFGISRAAVPKPVPVPVPVPASVELDEDSR